VNKPPNDGDPSAVGGFHFSDRRRKHRRSGKNRNANANGLGSTESLSGEGSVPFGSELERTIAATNTPPSRASRENKRANDAEHDPNREFDGLSNSRTLSSGNYPEFSRRENGKFVPPSNNETQSTAGYGFDARAEYQSKRKAGRPNKNTRPGRRNAVNRDKIIFPPKPNRQNRGIVYKTASNNRAKTSNNSAHPNKRRVHWSEAQDLGPLYAALDLGTNNCRLLVALPQQAGRFRVVDAYSRIVRLGRGMEGSGRLNDNSMSRAVEALGECARKLQNANIRKMRLIATEACRRAENGAQFLGRVKQETGLDLEIVDRETEAYLAAEGCGALVDKKADGAVLFDIGGGSSELILLDRRDRRHKCISEQISSWTSLPVGVVTLSERHGGREVTRSIFDAMVEEVERHLNQFEGRENLKDLWSKGRVHLLGTSGTVTTLAGVHLKLPRYDRRQVDGIWLRDDQVDRAIEQLIEMDYNQRAANPCIGSERADLVLAGCAILQAIRNTWPSPRLRVADRGLREGILTQMMNQDGAWITPKKGRKFQGRKSTNRNGSRPHLQPSASAKARCYE